LVDTRNGSNPTARLMLTILARVATWEREIMLERQRGALRRRSLKAPGVSTLIAVAGHLEYAAEGAVEALQATEHLRQSLTTPQQLYRPGTACRLNSGPFRDHDAVVAEIASTNAVVSVME
jgi:hypothetical protein